MRLCEKPRGYSLGGGGGGGGGRGGGGGGGGREIALVNAWATCKGTHVWGSSSSNLGIVLVWGFSIGQKGLPPLR